MRMNIISDGCYVYMDVVGIQSSYLFQTGPYGFAILAQSDFTTLESKDLIKDGGKTVTGDRSCQHCKLTGELTVLPVGSVDAVPEEYFYTQGASIPVVTHYFHRFYPATVIRNTGKVYLNSCPGDEVTSFPDQLDVYPKLRNAVFETRSEGVNAFSYRIYYEFCPSKTRWYTSSGNWSYRGYDFVNYKYRTSPTGNWTALGRLVTTSVPSYTSNLPQTWSQYEHFFKTLSRATLLEPSQDDVFGDLVRRCADDATVISSNNLEFTKELFEIKETLQAIFDLRKGKIDLKKLSSAYLMWKYGLRLTVKDVQSMASDITNEIGQIGKETSFSRAKEVATYQLQPSWGSTMSVEYTYKITFFRVANDWRDGIRNWMNSGFFPSLQNAWDLVPLSFVVDWFTHFNSFLSSIDANTYWCVTDVLGATYCSKRTYHDVGLGLKDQYHTLIGQAEAINYDRRTSPTLHKPLFFDPSPRDFHNYAEATALIVANLR